MVSTAGKYLQYQTYELHTYAFVLPRIDFRYLKSLSSGISILNFDGAKTAIAFTEAEARAKTGLVTYQSWQEGRIEITSTAVNTIDIKLNVKPDNSSKISTQIVDEEIYTGEKSIELFINSEGVDKYLLIKDFAPRMDLQYQFNKDRVLAVNNVYSWAACYLQLVIGDTFLPLGKYVHSSPDVIRLYRDGELVAKAFPQEDIAALGMDPSSAFGFSDGTHFSFGSGGDGTNNWMARIFKKNTFDVATFDVADVIQNGDVLVLDGVLVGKSGTATEGYEINLDLSFKITTVENGYQSSKTGYKFTLQ